MVRLVRKNMEDSPIQNIDQVDVLGERKDGGADLVISVSGPLDSSPETLKLLDAKIRAYITAVSSEFFCQKYIASKSRIIVSCAFPVSDQSRAIVNKLASLAAQHCIGLELRESLRVH